MDEFKRLLSTLEQLEVDTSRSGWQWNFEDSLKAIGEFVDNLSEFITTFKEEMEEVESQIADLEERIEELESDK